jgi:hypothetical protein
MIMVLPIAATTSLLWGLLLYLLKNAELLEARNPENRHQLVQQEDKVYNLRICHQKECAPGAWLMSRTSRGHADISHNTMLHVHALV